MTALQNLAETTAFEAVTAEFSTVIQAAGLPMTTLNPSWYETPLDYRRAMITRLQSILPRSVPASVRGTLSPQASADSVATTEQRVRDAVIAAAHDSPTLRTVVERDSSGREQISFFGQKRSWMGAYSKEPLLMRSIGGAPPVIPVVL